MLKLKEIEERSEVERQRAAAEERKVELEEKMLEICPRGNNKMIIIIFPCS